MRNERGSPCVKIVVGLDSTRHPWAIQGRRDRRPRAAGASSGGGGEVEVVVEALHRVDLEVVEVRQVDAAARGPVGVGVRLVVHELRGDDDEREQHAVHVGGAQVEAAARLRHV
eukprot:scaffold63946_cov61-Phaeocystis_antarctica.AAC.4